MTEPNANTQQHSYDDEIDLVELIANLWQEKWTIAICTGIALLLAIGYLLITKPVYLATTQLTPPNAAELAVINNTELINTSPNKVLGDILNYLESDKLRADLIEKNKSLIAEMNDVDEAEVTYEKFGNNLFSIKYPEVKKDPDPLLTQIYSLAKEGTDRAFITQLLDDAVTIAKETLINEWKNSLATKKQAQLTLIERNYSLLDNALNEQKTDTITRLTEQDELKGKQLADELSTRKIYLLNRRKDTILGLEEAVKIAAALNIKQPSTLKLLSRETSRQNSQVEVNTDLKDEKEPLYLRGTNLLSAELENQKSLGDDIFLDTRIREIEVELLRLENNRNIEILKARKDNKPFNETLQKLNEDKEKLISLSFPENIAFNIQLNEATSFTSPIKPKKSLILAISIVLGGMMGLFVAIGRIVYNNRKTNEA